MGQKFTYSIWVLCLTLLFSTLFWFFSLEYFQERTYLSPLPSFLDRGKNAQVRHLDIWLPHLAQIMANEHKSMQLSAKAVLMYDLTSNTALFEKNSKEQLPMASLTKIMTAIIALENTLESNTYLVSKDALVGEDSMGLTFGETLTLDELLYGLFLNSGNDAAEVLAAHFPGGRDSFIQAMNDKVKSLGISNTHFTNPSGLQGDGEQYTTTYDLLVITRYALENFPKLISIASTVERIIPQTTTHKAYFLLNETNLLTSYPGVKGLKTGYTPEAGLCLVTYYEDNGHKIIGILLNSENRRQEMKDLLDYSLTALGIKPPVHD